MTVHNFFLKVLVHMTLIFHQVGLSVWKRVKNQHPMNIVISPRFMMALRIRQYTMRSISQHHYNPNVILKPNSRDFFQINKIARFAQTH